MTEFVVVRNCLWKGKFYRMGETLQSDPSDGKCRHIVVHGSLPVKPSKIVNPVVEKAPVASVAVAPVVAPVAQPKVASKPKAKAKK